MTWHEFSLARQQLTEEFVGTRLRAAKAQEDAAVKQARKRLNSGPR